MRRKQEILLTSSTRRRPGGWCGVPQRGRCRLTWVSVCDAIEDRDTMIASGMETGVVQGYAKLDRVLATLS